MNKLNVHCPINGTGYGITSKNIVMSIDALSVEICLFPIGGQIQIESETEKQYIKKFLNNSHVYDPSKPCLKIWHQHDLATRVGNGTYYVFPFFEVDRLSDLEIHQLNCSDHIFTATNWSKKVLEDNKVTKPISVVPLGVNHDIFNISPVDPYKIQIENDNYVFLHVGKWEMRKSQDFLLKAFDKAFSHKDNVELWLVPFNPFLTKEENLDWMKLANSCRIKDKIKIFDRLPTQHHLAEVMNQADCGIFLSRAEGWNNEIPEMMAMNKPIIATNYSAHTEYCTKENSFLVDVNEVEPAVDNKWFNGFGNWAKLTEKELEQTVEYMKFVYTNNITTNESGLSTAKFYSWDRTASTICDYIYPKKKARNANTKKKRR